jgi:hypothetical protein
MVRLAQAAHGQPAPRFTALARGNLHKLRRSAHRSREMSQWHARKSGIAGQPPGRRAEATGCPTVGEPRRHDHRVRTGDQLRPAVRRARRSDAGQPGLHWPADRPTHGQPLPRSGPHPATAALPCQRRRRRRIRPARRLPRSGTAARRRPGRLRLPGHNAGHLRLPGPGRGTARDKADDRRRRGRPDPGGQVQQPVDGADATPRRQRAREGATSTARTGRSPPSCWLRT